MVERNNEPAADADPESVGADWEDEEYTILERAVVVGMCIVFGVIGATLLGLL